MSFLDVLFSHGMLFSLKYTEHHQWMTSRWNMTVSMLDLQMISKRQLKFNSVYIDTQYHLYVHLDTLVVNLLYFIKLDRDPSHQ